MVVEKRQRRWEMAGLLLTLIVGNLLHFTYGWSGGSRLAAAFSAVNESTWEHMKLLAVPWIAWSLAEAIASGKDGGSVLFPRAVGLLAGLAAIPVTYYTVSGIFGRPHHLVNILIFQLAVLLAFFVSRRMRESGRFKGGGRQLTGLLLMLLIGALFLRWTYRTPDLPIFSDPGTGVAGIPR